MTNERFFREQVDNYFRTRKNKRYGKDQMAYEVNWPALVVRGAIERKQRTFRIRHNYAFLTSVPKWREIFATEFEGRRADHEVCDVLMPLANRILSPRTYNNRKGKGGMAAINQVIEDMSVVTNGYTERGWIIKLDIKGFFPSARWNYAESCLDKVIALFDEPEHSFMRKDYLKWLTMILVHANPAAHCELRTPRHYWFEHIEPDKSLMSKPEGEGAAIGRLIWQTAMGLYINDEVKWLNDECGVRTVCFVDDMVIQVPDRQKNYALSLIPELRKRLARKNIRLNEKKFYCQPCHNGLEFLGTHIRPYRLHLNNSTYGRAEWCVRRLNKVDDKERYIERVLPMINSYTGMLKNRTDYKRMMNLVSLVLSEWGRYFKWNADRQCIVARNGYSYKERKARRWNIKIKMHNKQNN